MLFDELTASATARNPRDRFTGAHEFLDALDDVSASLRLPHFVVPLPTQSAAHRVAAIPTSITHVPEAVPEEVEQVEEVEPYVEPRRPEPETNRSTPRLVVALLLMTAATAAVAVGGWWYGSGFYGMIPELIRPAF